MKYMLFFTVLVLLGLTGCFTIASDMQELNSAKPILQKSPFEPLKIYTHCPDNIVCYVKTPNAGDYTGMWCTRDADLTFKYCEKLRL